MTSNRSASILKAALLAYWLALFTVTHLPASRVIETRIWDKAAHFVAYAGLAFLLAAAWSLRTTLTLRHYGIILAVMAVYGAIDEILQSPVGRDTDARDWLADILGTLLALACFRLLMALLPKGPVAMPGDKSPTTEG
ncbi:MAG: VanZ family protein [Pirellulales bacterium]